MTSVDLEILSASQFRGFILSLNLFNDGPPDKSIGNCPPGDRFETETADSTVLTIRKQNFRLASLGQRQLIFDSFIATKLEKLAFEFELLIINAEL